MAFVLILLIIGLFIPDSFYNKAAIILLVINMSFPILFYPFAIIWIGFSHLLGTVMSKIILTVVYGFLVIPIGGLRKLFGKDSLQLSEFKKSSDSVMLKRNYDFSAKDIEKPY